jgi:DNA mismatch endonuclease (patch repair protein)
LRLSGNSEAVENVIMPDKHTPEQRSANMSRIRSTGTAPERQLGELLRLMFPDQELVQHPKELPGKPDWFLPQLRLVVFADGCFFHMCPKHFIMPERNRDYWEPKLRRNRERDRQINAELKLKGFVPIRVWEHDLRRDTANARRKIRRIVRSAETPNSSRDTPEAEHQPAV